MKTRFSLRLALMLVIVTSALGALLLNGFLIDWTLRDFHRATAERDISIAIHETQASIHFETANLTRITTEIAAQKNLVSALNLLSNYQDPGNYSAILFDEEKKKLVRQLALLRDAYSTDGIFIYDNRGRLCCYNQRMNESVATVIISYEAGEWRPLRHNAETRQWEPYTLPPETSLLIEQHQSDLPGVDFHRLNCCVLIEAHGQVIKNTRDQNERLGMIILSKNIEPILTNASQQPTLTSKVQVLFQDDLSGYLSRQAPTGHPVASNQGIKTGTLLENENIFYRISELPLTASSTSEYLYLIASYPKRLYLEARDNSRSVLLSVLLLVGLAIIPISLMVTQRLFTQPLKKLLREVENARNEDHPLQVSPHKSQELNHLAEAINEMTGKIRHREIELKSIIDNIPLMVFVKDVDDLTFVDFNAAGERLMGVKREQLIGKNDFDFFPAVQAESFVALDRMTLESGKPRHIDEEPIETPRGTRLIRTIKVPVLDDQGQPRYLLGVSEDITDKKQAEEYLRLWAKVFENSNEGIIITDHESRILSVNRAFTQITGHREIDIRGQTPAILHSGRHDKKFFSDMWAELNEKGNWAGEIWNKRSDGSLFPVWESISAVYNDKHKITNFIGIFSDISVLKETTDKLDFLAHHDPLTSLPNRTLLNDRLKHAIARTIRNHQALALMFLDLDQFKDINDTKGHPVGDALLIEVSERLNKIVRDSDTLGRLGGDEFLIILENCEDNDQITHYTNRILSLFREPFEVEGQQISISVSIGGSLCPDDTTDPVLLIRNADTAMYRAKAAGRNRCVFYDVDMTQQADQRVRLEQDLRHALARDELELFYQPQIDLKRQVITGAEALIRWHHPTRGLVSPIEFIPIAESTGMIHTIGDWIINTAISQFLSWKQAGISLDNIAINVSPRQLGHGEFASNLWSAIQRHGIESSELEIEITEDVFMGGDEIVRNNLLSIHALGAHLALDDFGTGFSSLSYLKNFPFGRLKIDRGFIRDMLEDANDLAIAKSIIVLGHSLDMEIIAEGVETAEHQQILIDEACDIGQGYYYNRPLPTEEFARYYLSLSASPDRSKTA